MSKLEQLIAELCPEGVKYKALGEIAVRTKGTPITAAKMKELDKPNASIKIFAGGKTVAHFDHGDLPEKDINTYPSVIVKSRGVIEFEYYDKPFSHKNEMWSYHSEQENVDVKYLYYFLKTQENRLREKATSMGAFPKIAIPDTEKIDVPLPPLPIQREIVRILDNFTELTAELTARKKQYEHYRNELLTFGDDVPMVQLSNCCVSIADGDHQAPPKVDDGIPFITISDISSSNQIDFIDTKFVPESYYSALADKRRARLNVILYTVVGSFGVPVIIESEMKFTFQRHIAILRPDSMTIIPKYLYHALQSSDIKKQADMVAAGAAQRTITLSALNKMTVPLPSLEEQARIVDILDKFATLTTDITSGLPAEIETHNKQYEYYRDKLLTFKEAGV